MCRPTGIAVPGSLHILHGRGVGNTTYEWTGTAWSTPGTGWGTKPGFMAALGWRYVGPAAQVAAPDSQEQKP